MASDIQILHFENGVWTTDRLSKVNNYLIQIDIMQTLHINLKLVMLHIIFKNGQASSVALVNRG